MAKTSLQLADDQMCFGCGRGNAKGLKLRFTLDPKRKEIQTRWKPTKTSQGYANIVHGGMIGLVLDELMVNLLWKLGLPSVTAEMSVRFLSPARVGRVITCRAKIASQRGRLFTLKATAQGAGGRKVAEATAKCLRVARA